MKIHRIAAPETTSNFDAALRHAPAVAKELLDENMLHSLFKIN